jgi:hypothetical protein
MYVVISALAAWAGLAAMMAGVPEPTMFALFVLFFLVWLAFAYIAPVIGARLPARLRRQVDDLLI